MHSKSNNIEFMLYDNATEVVNEHFEWLLSRYQIGLETSMRGSDFIFDLVQLLYYKYHKINFKRGGWDNDSPDWIKKKKAIINTKNTDDKYFQYAVTVSLNYGEVNRNPEIVSNIKQFINKCNWKGINTCTLHKICKITGQWKSKFLRISSTDKYYKNRWLENVLQKESNNCF